MILALSTRVDTALWLRLEEAAIDSAGWMRHRRRWLVTIALIASVLDLVLTQTILGMVADLTGTQPAEANPFMAPIVMSWWGWPVRVGLPAMFLAWHLRGRAYGCITWAAALYAAVVIWNTHMLVLVQGALP